MFWVHRPSGCPGQVPACVAEPHQEFAEARWVQEYSKSLVGTRGGYAGMTQTIEAAIDKENRSIFSIYLAIFRGQSILAIPWCFRTCVRCTAAKGWMTWRRWIWRAFHPQARRMSIISNTKVKHWKEAKLARKTKYWNMKLALFASLCISLHMPAGLMHPNPAWAHWIPLIYTYILYI